MHGADIALYALIGVGTGFISGMFGIGGGSVRIPLLSLTGMPLLTAYATNMAAIPFSAATGAYVQRKNIKWKIVKPFVAGAMLGVAIATVLAETIPESALAVIFFFAALITTAGLYLKKISKKLYRRLKPTTPSLMIGAFVSNLIIGLRGGSGGTLFPPLLTALHIKMHKAIATSHLASFCSACVALAIYLPGGSVLLAEGILMGVTGAFGSYAGSKVSMKTDSKKLKAALAITVMALACSVLYGTFL